MWNNSHRWEPESTPLNPEDQDDPYDYTDFDKSGWIDNKNDKWAILRYDDPDFKVGEDNPKI